MPQASINGHPSTANGPVKQREMNYSSSSAVAGREDHGRKRPTLCRRHILLVRTVTRRRKLLVFGSAPALHSQLKLSTSSHLLSRRPIEVSNEERVGPADSTVDKSERKTTKAAMFPHISLAGCQKERIPPFSSWPLATVHFTNINCVGLTCCFFRLARLFSGVQTRNVRFVAIAVFTVAAGTGLRHVHDLSVNERRSDPPSARLIRTDRPGGGRSVFRSITGFRGG
jgi:hypothetical protein